MPTEIYVKVGTHPQEVALVRKNAKFQVGKRLNIRRRDPWPGGRHDWPRKWEPVMLDEMTDMGNYVLFRCSL